MQYAAAAAKSLQLCLTLYDPRNSSPPGSPVPGILQARILAWVAISFSNAWKWKVKVKLLSRVWLIVTPWTTAYQAPHPCDFPGESTEVGCHRLLLMQYESLSKDSVREFSDHQDRVSISQKTLNMLCSRGCLHSLSNIFFSFIFIFGHTLPLAGSQCPQTGA